MPSADKNGDRRGLLAHQGSPPQMPSTSDLSRIPRHRSDDDTTWEPDDQHLLSLNQRSSAREAVAHNERESSAQPDKERVDELLALMEKSQRQIQQLLQSQQAVQDVVDHITPQQLPRVGPSQSRERNKQTCSIQRDGSKRTTDSKWSEMHDEAARPEEPFHMPANAKFQPPIDDAYYQQNPWYGQPPKRPVFGLGGPLPHTVREYFPNSKAPASQQQDPEKGQANPQMSEKTFSLGAPLPHKKCSRPVSRHKPTHTLAGNLPHQGNRKQQHKSRHGPSRTTAVERAEKSEARQGQNEKLLDEDQDPARGRSRPRDDGRSQENFNPFASFDRIGEGYDEEGYGSYRSNSDGIEGNGQEEHDDEEPTNWAIDAEPIGHSEDEEAESGEKDPDELRNWWARIRAKHPEPLAEFLCTFTSIFLGMCATLQIDLSNGEYGNYETSCWAWGISFMFGVYVGGGVSGAHMNPAISFSLWVFRGFPRKQMMIYWISQLLGCICAAALAYAVFYDSIHYTDPGLMNTATSFYSKPQSFVSPTIAFFTQFIAAAVMMLSVLALGDDQNNPPGAGLHAFVMGLVVTMQKMTLGYNTGVALNPASDFGPRLVCLMVGYNTPMFTERGLWWLWGPWAATIAGSMFGCSLYDSLVFVGSESPINYRVPTKVKERLKKAKRLGN